MQRNWAAQSVVNVFLHEDCEVSALWDFGYRGFQQVESQQLVSDLQPRIEWTLKESETPRRPCSESSASPWSHAVRWFESCGIVPAVFCSPPPQQTAEVCCFVRMTQADWGPPSSPCRWKTWAVLMLSYSHFQIKVSEGTKTELCFFQGQNIKDVLAC